MVAHSLSTHLNTRLSARRMAAFFVCSLVLLGSPEPAFAETNHIPSDISPILSRQNTPSGNVTCKDPTVTWYNTADGLNPCQQYERLRRICQPTFKTPSMPRTLSPSSVPGTCEAQLKDCCCNSVSFNLAVTCAACQWGVGTGAEGDLGIDASVGTYQTYLGQCIGSSVNQSIATVAQHAACNSGLDLPGFLYNLFWPDGALYFHYMYEWASLHSTAGDSSSGRCDNTTMSSIRAAQNGGNGGSSTSKGPDQNVVIAIVGGVLGGLGLLSTLAVLLWVKCRGNKRKSTAKTHPLEPSYNLDNGAPKRTWRDYRPVPLHTPASSISGFSSIRDSTTLPVSDPSTPTPFMLSARTSNAEQELDPFDAIPRPGQGPRSGSNVVIGNGGISDTRRDAKLRTIERHPDGKAPLPYAFDMDAGSSSGSGSGSGGSSGGRSGRRRDDKLRAIERHPDGKLAVPYAFESSGGGSASRSREVKVARVTEDSAGLKRRDDARLSQTTSAGTQTQLRSARPPSYATQAR